jgi:hypothetical protein
MEEDVWIDKLTEWRMNGWDYRRMERGICGRRDGWMTYCLSPLSVPLLPFTSPSLVTTRINEMNPHN